MLNGEKVKRHLRRRERVHCVALSNTAEQEAGSRLADHLDVCVKTAHVYWKQDCMWIRAVLDRQEVIQHQLRFLAGGRTVSQISVAGLISSVLFFRVCRIRLGGNKSAPDLTDATATLLSFAAVIQLIATHLFYMEY